MGWCCINYLPSRGLTYPTLGKGKSSSKCHFWGDMLVSWRVPLVEPPTSSSDMRHVVFFESFRGHLFIKKNERHVFQNGPFSGGHSFEEI